MTQSKFFKEDLYRVLGVHPTSDLAEIRSKYRQAALKMHPDKGGSSESFHLLSFAFEVLSCYPSRLMYDRATKLKTPFSKGNLCRKTALHAKSSKIASGKNATRFSQPTNNRWKRSTDKCVRTEPPSKYQRIFRDPYSRQERCERLSPHLSQVRAILQEMKPELRQTSIQRLSPRLRVVLTDFMKSGKASSLSHPKNNCDDMERKHIQTRSSTKRLNSFGCMISNATGNQNPMYKAHVHIKALRFYTHGQTNLKVALHRQMILVQLRQALIAASKTNLCFWEDARAAHQICSEVLLANNTSETEMGLSSYVYLRAGHLLIQSCTIISPVMPLGETLQWHCRLLRARRKSWQALRAEWVELMQSSRQPPARRRTLIDAEAIADEARAHALKTQFTRAVRKLAKAVELDEKLSSTQHRMMAYRLRKEQQKLASARKSHEKERRERFKLRRKWLKRSDLTMGDIMQGPPLNYS